MDLATRVESVLAEVNAIKTELKNKINSLPDNPNITRLNHNCFTVKFSEIGKNNMNLSPEYYDFKVQYQSILTYLESLDIKNFIFKLKKVLKQGFIMRKSYLSSKLPTQFDRVPRGSTSYKVTLHPDVVKNINELI